MVHKRKVRIHKEAKDTSGLGREEAPAEEGSAKPEGAWKPATEQERKEVTQKAIEVIKKGLKENPEAQKDGKPYLPLEWSKQFKPVLGPYRKFLERCSVFVIKEGDLPPRSTVHLQDGAAAATPDKLEWEVLLDKTWQVYLHNVKKEDRKPEEFVALARKLASQAVKVEGESK